MPRGIRTWWWMGVAIAGTLVFLLDGTVGQSFAYKVKEKKVVRPFPRIEKKEAPQVVRGKRRENRRVRVSALRSSDSRWYRIHVPPPSARRRPVRQRKRPTPVVREIVKFPAIVPEPGKDFQSMLLADADTGQLLLAENIN
jgi:hypothetical protein